MLPLPSARPPAVTFPAQPQSVTAPWPVPSYTASWQRYIGVNNLPKVVTQLLPRVYELNPRYIDRKSNALPVAPPRQSNRNHILDLFTAWRHASAVYAVIVCPSVRPSVRLSVTRRYCTKMANVGSRKQRHTIAQKVYFSGAKDLSEIPTGSLPTKSPTRGRVSSDGRFSTSISLYPKNGAR